MKKKKRGKCLNWYYLWICSRQRETCQQQAQSFSSSPSTTGNFLKLETGEESGTYFPHFDTHLISLYFGHSDNNKKPIRSFSDSCNSQSWCNLCLTGPPWFFMFPSLNFKWDHWGWSEIISLTLFSWDCGDVKTSPAESLPLSSFSISVFLYLSIPPLWVIWRAIFPTGWQPSTAISAQIPGHQSLWGVHW